eukprot:TRINITY_DN11379_c0_g1_i10.p1 TRINITY_DN11379_c0_g1~~TRINITY_DN11379_c0_g1_i10.p1  ORF type:complete len:754 (+),score=133.11 TRINITY_DN11379_c0_g1_i10:63-2324(+)
MASTSAVSCSTKRESEENSGPPCKVLKCCPKVEDWDSVQLKVEECMLKKCLCPIDLLDLDQHLKPLLTNKPELEKNLLLINLLDWTAKCYHDSLASGLVCASVQSLVNHVLQDVKYLQALLNFTEVGDAYMKYCSCQAISSLLPLSFCGQDIALPASELFLKDVIGQMKFVNTQNIPSALNLQADLPSMSVASLPDLPSMSSGLANLPRLLPDSGSLLAGLPSLPSLPGGLCGIPPEMATAACLPDMMSSNHGYMTPPEPSSGELECHDLSCHDLDQQSWLLRILHDFVSHGGKQKEDSNSAEREISESCTISELEDEMLCQETQVKCATIKLLEPVWEKFTLSLATITANFPSSTRTLPLHEESTSNLARVVYAIEGFSLWRALISVRANLNFVECRNFSANLSVPVHQLKKSTPALVWKQVLETVSECLCYGSTLGLQSIPPEEPCQLAHTLIRLVRFDGFLSRIPYNQSKGFGGSAAMTSPQSAMTSSQPAMTSPQSEDLTARLQTGEEEGGEEEEGEESYDKGLVQKIILIVLKSVALTTREARVDSSSGESDSSLSSRESASSCNSDLVIIERNMNGVYKQLDKFIKNILPVLPDTCLQENILNLLQEQDDVLIEGLLCLLDTHIALQNPNKDSPQVSPETCPTLGFTKFLSIVGEDSSVLLDFLVSNETCFLLYLLRYLKFVLKDWGRFVEACGPSYESTVGVIIQLKSSIQRLLTKDLFPYNIAPVYKLLERIELMADQNKPQQDL